ncbi:MAG: ABC transporter permease [Thalassobaculaceae bacterium]|nr:ABC transporter permease [Thalassobaculaceae bacterium]
MTTLFDHPDNTWELIANGLPWTLSLAGGSLALGFFLAIGLALVRLSPFRPLQWVAYAYVYLFRSTPLLVQIFLIYYGLGQFEAVQKSFMWPFLREAHWCAVLALTLNTTAYTSEIIRGGLLAVPWGQVEAAKACGMGMGLRFRRVVFPQAIRQALPAYGNEIVLMVKSTSLVSTITILDMTLIARKETSATFSIEPLFIAAVFYLVINFLATRAVMWLEYRMSPDLREARTGKTLPDQDVVRAH